MEWDMLGHEWAARLLQMHISREQVRHAYLFIGPEGVGRRSLALRFAQCLNCLQPPSPGLFCGTCRACRQIEKMQQADLSIIQSEADSAAIKVDQVRELQRTLSLSPYESRYRIALLLRFHEATAGAQNALLKTLEEAPQKVILLLTADSSEGILPTIYSRCEVLRLRPLQVGVLEKALQERWSIPLEEARVLAHLSGGRAGYALQMHADPTSLEERQGWVEDFFTLLEGSQCERLAYADGYRRKNRDVVRRLLQTWLLCYRDALIFSVGADAPPVNVGWEHPLQSLGRSSDTAFIRHMISKLERAVMLIETSNVNAQLLLENTLVHFPNAGG